MSQITSIKKYIIATTPRSGSSHLCTLFKQTGTLGYPEEWLSNFHIRNHLSSWKIDKSSYIRELIDRYGCLGFGIKMMMGYFHDSVSFLADAYGLDFPTYRNFQQYNRILNSVFGNVNFIWLTRRNKIKQAISWAIASKTNQYARYNGQSAVGIDINAIPLDYINYYLRLINEHEGYWQEYFEQNNIIPLNIVYEDYIQNNKQTIQAVFEFLSINSGFDFKFQEIIVKQSNDVNQTLYEHFLRDHNNIP